MSEDPEIGIDFKRLHTLSRRVQLRDVSLVATSFQCLQHPTSFPREVQKSFLYELERAQWQRTPDSDVVSVFLVFDVNARVSHEGEGETIETDVFHHQCIWNAIYTIRLDEDFQLDDETMADFCFANSQLNVYPYVRQLVQDLTGRAGWPALVMPVFTVPSSRPAGVVERTVAGNREEVLLKAAH